MDPRATSTFENGLGDTAPTDANRHRPRAGLTHLAVFSAVILPITLFPYLITRRQVSLLRRKVDQLNTLISLRITAPVAEVATKNGGQTPRLLLAMRQELDALRKQNEDLKSTHSMSLASLRKELEELKPFAQLHEQSADRATVSHQSIQELRDEISGLRVDFERTSSAVSAHSMSLETISKNFAEIAELRKEDMDAAVSQHDLAELREEIDAVRGKMDPKSATESLPVAFESLRADLLEHFRSDLQLIRDELADAKLLVQEDVRALRAEVEAARADSQDDIRLLRRDEEAMRAALENRIINSLGELAEQHAHRSQLATEQAVSDIFAFRSDLYKLLAQQRGPKTQ